MAHDKLIAPLGDSGKRRKDGGERAAAGEQLREGLGGCAGRDDPPVGFDEMPRVEAGIGRDRREQARALGALDRNGAQALCTIPAKDLVERPPAKAAVLVVQQDALRRAAQRALSRGVGTGASVRRTQSTTTGQLTNTITRVSHCAE